MWPFVLEPGILIFDPYPLNISKTFMMMLGIEPRASGMLGEPSSPILFSSLRPCFSCRIKSVPEKKNKQTENHLPSTSILDISASLDDAPKPLHIAYVSALSQSLGLMFVS